MKKSLILFLTILFLSTFILAQQNQIGTPEISKSIDLLILKIGELFEKIKFIDITPLFNYLISISDLILKGFFASLLFLMIYTALDMINFIEEKKVIKIGISILITLVSFFAIPVEVYDSLIPLYKSFFSTILSVIPLFLILTLSFKGKPMWAVRLLWIFITIFFGFAFIGVGIPSISDKLYFQGIIYFILFIFSLLMCIFLKTFRRYFFDQSINDAIDEMKRSTSIDKAVQEAHKTEGEALKESVEKLT